MNGRYTHRARIISHQFLVVFNGWSWAVLRQESRIPSRFPTGWKGPKYFSHHLLPPRVHISRELELGYKLGPTNMNCGQFMQHVKLETKYLPHISFLISYFMCELSRNHIFAIPSMWIFFLNTKNF